MNISMLFLSYLNTLKCNDNNTLIESIKHGYRTILEAKQNKEFRDISRYVFTLFDIETQIHIWHLNAPNVHSHNLLDDLYNDIITWTDSIAESIMGITKSHLTFDGNIDRELFLEYESS